DTTAPVTTASPAGGQYHGPVSVSLTCNDEASGCAATYYTVDGNEPTTGSRAYGSQIQVTDATTIKFFSKDLAGNSEPVRTETYTIAPPSAPPDMNGLPFLGVLLDDDADHDGIPDVIENRTCTDPNNPDTDRDGLKDGVEDANRNGVLDSGETNPCLADTDGDGLNDGVEDANRNGRVDSGETDPRKRDTDGDGMPDGYEVQHVLNPLVNDCGLDPDGDGWTNCEEYRFGTDPRNPLSHPNRGLPWLNILLGK
ncbi:MAG: chitobiase/beta-hexosaminidase C-terminal domain-containing protein, partial [Proteobacteria bacterium]|nr:chitobiase/beta-hexosaminidase C-terminal domain-containing protein [Pseudomonadota bacterium]